MWWVIPNRCIPRVLYNTFHIMCCQSNEVPFVCHGISLAIWIMTSCQQWWHGYTEIQGKKFREIRPNIGTMPIDCLELWGDSTAATVIKKLNLRPWLELLRSTSNFRVVLVACIALLASVVQYGIFIPCLVSPWHTSRQCLCQSSLLLL